MKAKKILIYFKMDVREDAEIKLKCCWLKITYYSLIAHKLVSFVIFILPGTQYCGCRKSLLKHLVSLLDCCGRLSEVSKWAGTQYFYPSEIVHSTGRNYWTPPKLVVVKTTSTMVDDRLVKYFYKKLMITSIAEFSHSNRTTASRPSWWDIYSLF